MPGHLGLKKDAPNGETLGSCKEAKIRRYPNGGTRHPGGMTPDTEHIGITGGTRGTETSKYPKEKKTKVIS